MSSRSRTEKPGNIRQGRSSDVSSTSRAKNPGNSHSVDAEYPVRKKLSHFIPPWINHESYFFITICGNPRGHNQFCVSETAQCVLDSAAYYHEQGRWNCRLMLLMPDHIHGIIAFPRAIGLRSIMGAWKRYLSKTTVVQWQSGFFDHRLRDRFQIEEKTSYILNNPVRAGLCKHPEDWPYKYHPCGKRD